MTLWQNSIAIGNICNLYFRNLNFKKVPNDWQLSRANINLSVPLDQIYFSCEGRFYQLGQIELQLLNILSHWFEHSKGSQNVIKKPKKVFIYINNIQGLQRKSGDRKVHHGRIETLQVHNYSPVIGQNSSTTVLLLADCPPSDPSPSHSEHMIYVLERVAHRTRQS